MSGAKMSPSTKITFFFPMPAKSISNAVTLFDFVVGISPNVSETEKRSPNIAAMSWKMVTQLQLHGKSPRSVGLVRGATVSAMAAANDDVRVAA